SCIFSISILSFALGIFLPWWSIAIAAFIIPFAIVQKPLMAFLSGFLAIFILWGLQSYVISLANNHILANRISQVILKKENPDLLILLTASVGGIVSGFSSLSGSFLRLLFKQQNSN
ncbi:MAG: hypothetical protein ACO29O_06250, partial [Chitinophagaceae bacterium]